jgi:DNA-binding LacI/PurR family transcriptional regulator
MAITIKDVAEKAGVSISTVSKVINHSPTISNATVERVNAIMRELHYYPNLRARNFAQQATRNIAFITMLRKDVAFTNPHMFEIMCGAQRSLSAKDYSLTLVNAEDDADAIALIEKIIAQKSADGMIIHSCTIDKKFATTLVRSGFPHILIGRPEFESQLCWIDSNNYLAGEIAANHLLDIGRRRIAFVGGYESDLISAHRLSGVQTAFHEKNIEIPPAFIKCGDSTRELSYQLADELLAEPERPDAIICANNNIALGVVKALHQHRIDIPGDIAVITFDDYPYSRIMEPMATVVNIDVYDMGIQAGKLLLSKIKTPNLHVQSYTTLPNLIVRESTVKSLE